MRSLPQVNTAPKTRILVVSDHPLVRGTLTKFLNEMPDMAVCSEAEDAGQAFTAIAKEMPDLVLLDLSLLTGDGFSLIRSLRTRFDDLPIIILSMHSEYLFAERALRAGANGYVTKSEAPKKLVPAIHEVMEGKLYVTDAIRQDILQRVRGGKSPTLRIEGLSDRELEIFHLLGSGYGTPQIARMLDLSQKTIESHRSNLKKKLNIEDSFQLLKKASDWVNKHTPP